VESRELLGGQLCFLLSRLLSVWMYRLVIKGGMTCCKNYITELRVE
jgi:hypothetical protein